MKFTTLMWLQLNTIIACEVSQGVLHIHDSGFKSETFFPNTNIGDQDIKPTPPESHNLWQWGIYSQWKLRWEMDSV